MSTATGTSPISSSWWPTPCPSASRSRTASTASTRSWRELERAHQRARARTSRAATRPGDKLAIYSYNRPEFVEALIARAEGAPRAGERQLPLPRGRARSTCSTTPTRRRSSTRRRSPAASRSCATGCRSVREWIELARRRARATPSPSPTRRSPRGAAARLDDPAQPGRPALPLHRRHHRHAEGRDVDAGRALRGARRRRQRGARRAAVARASRSSARASRAERAAQRLLPACPLMHGTGQFTAINALGGGGAIVTCDGQRLDADELWRHRRAARGVQALAIVGDAFAKPMLRALEENPGRCDLSRAALIVSSGVMWSPAVKQGLLAPPARTRCCMDSFGSSEAVGFGTELTTKDRTVQLGSSASARTARCSRPTAARSRPAAARPASSRAAARSRSATTRTRRRAPRPSRRYQGRRWSIPGDWCTVNADGTLKLHGRGSVCINTGGEKVYPRRGRGDAEAPSGRARTPSSSACPTRSGARR